MTKKRNAQLVEAMVESDVWAAHEAQGVNPRGLALVGNSIDTPNSKFGGFMTSKDGFATSPSLLPQPTASSSRRPRMLAVAVTVCCLWTALTGWLFAAALLVSLMGSNPDLTWICLEYVVTATANFSCALLLLSSGTSTRRNAVSSAMLAVNCVLVIEATRRNLGYHPGMLWGFIGLNAVSACVVVAASSWGATIGPDET